MSGNILEPDRPTVAPPQTDEMVYCAVVATSTSVEVTLDKLNPAGKVSVTVPPFATPSVPVRRLVPMLVVAATTPFISVESKPPRTPVMLRLVVLAVAK